MRRCVVEKAASALVGIEEPIDRLAQDVVTPALLRDVRPARRRGKRHGGLEDVSYARPVLRPG